MPGYPASGVLGQVVWINHTDPSAGQNFILQFNTTNFPGQSNYVYELLQLRFTLATSATVATRTVNLDCRQNAALCFANVPTVTQAATLTYQYWYGKGVANSAALTLSNRVLGFLPLEPFFFVVDDSSPSEYRTNITNLQAGDSITNVYANYRISKQ